MGFQSVCLYRLHRTAACVITLGLCLHTGMSTAGAARDATNEGDAISRLGSGSINWTRGLVIGRGFAGPDLRAPSVTVGRIGAERAARQAAGTSLCSALWAVPLEAGRTVGAEAQQGPARERVQSLCGPAAKVADTKVFSDGSVEVSLEVPVDALLTAATQREARANQATVLIVLPKGAAATAKLIPRLVDEGGSALAWSKGAVRFALNEAAAKRTATGKVAQLKAVKVGAEGELTIDRAEYQRAVGELGNDSNPKLIIVGDLKP